jgi:hypothetical protein
MSAKSMQKKTRDTETKTRDAIKKATQKNASTKGSDDESEPISAFSTIKRDKSKAAAWLETNG